MEILQANALWIVLGLGFLLLMTRMRGSGSGGGGRQHGSLAGQRGDQEQERLPALEGEEKEKKPAASRIYRRKSCCE